ncbi:MAG: hypothetical protein KDE66_06550, partial [Nitrosomonas sp.]|nr:hypothetical protein [Nitrosomonas sp.]
ANFCLILAPLMTPCKGLKASMREAGAGFLHPAKNGSRNALYVIAGISINVRSVSALPQFDEV